VQRIHARGAPNSASLRNPKSATQGTKRIRNKRIALHHH
jgi:hypothetical protein